MLPNIPPVVPVPVPAPVPKVFEGGGPAGVVEGPPNENVGADVAGAGVVEPEDAEEVLPNSDGADVDGVEVVEVWPRLKRDFGAPGVPTGAVDASFETSDGLLKP